MFYVALKKRLRQAGLTALMGGFLFSLISGVALAGSYESSTFLGQPYTGDSGQATAAYLDMPGGFTYDSDGNIYIADTFNNAIRKINSSGVISTISGDGEFGHKDGSTDEAEWAWPQGIARASDGTLYVADTFNNAIRKIADSKVSTLSLTSKLSRPNAIIISGSTLFVSDNGNSRIVKISTGGGAVTEVKGSLNNPQKIALNGNDLYVTEFDNGNVIKINISTGSKSTFASGLDEPRSLFIYNGKLYLSAGENGVWNQIISIELSSGTVTELARRRETELLNNSADMFIREVSGAAKIYQLFQGGSSIYRFDIDGQNEEHVAGVHRYGDKMDKRTAGLLGHPEDIIASPDGKKMYISYMQGNNIAVYDFDKDMLTHLAGFPMDNYNEDKSGTDARFSDATNLAISPDGKTLYIADRNNNRIRTLDTTSGMTGYLTGAGEFNSDGDSNNGYQEGGPCKDQFENGVAGCAYFNRPTGIVITSDGKTLYIADASNNRVRKVTIATGQTALVAGSGSEGFVNGTGSSAQFRGPFTLALSSDEKTLYVTDKYNHAIRAIDLATNKVTTLTGNGKIGYKEGAFKDAVFSIPEFIERGPDGNLYVSEAGGLHVRKLDLSAQKTTLVAGGGGRGMKNGSEEKSEYNVPKGMAFLSHTLYITDFYNDLIRAVDFKGDLPGPDYVSPPGKGFMGYSSTLRGGYFVATGNVLGDAKDEIITGTGKGFGPHLQVYDNSGNVKSSFFVYDKSLRSGVRAAAGDVNGDGTEEIITCAGPSGKPHVRIFAGDGTLINPGFFALDGKFKGGIYCAAGDVNGDGKAEIVVAAGKGGGAQVTVHLADGTSIANFFPYKNFSGGITVSTLDTDGDGKDEIITGPEFGAPHIQYFGLENGKVKQLHGGFYAFDADTRGGVSVAGGDYDGDGADEIIVGSGEGVEPLVRVFNKHGTRIIKEFRPYAKQVRGGTMVAAGDVDNDGFDEILVVPRSNGGPHIQVVDFN